MQFTFLTGLQQEVYAENITRNMEAWHFCISDSLEALLMCTYRMRKGKSSMIIARVPYDSNSKGYKLYNSSIRNTSHVEAFFSVMENGIGTIWGKLQLLSMFRRWQWTIKYKLSATEERTTPITTNYKYSKGWKLKWKSSQL